MKQKESPKQTILTHSKNKVVIVNYIEQDGQFWFGLRII